MRPAAPSAWSGPALVGGRDGAEELDAVLRSRGRHARLANFTGYVSWCCWLVAMAIVLWRDKLQGGRQRLAAANTAVGSA